jgi:beta-galactosidase
VSFSSQSFEALAKEDPFAVEKFFSLAENEMKSITLPTTPSLGVCYYPEHLPPEYWAPDFDSMREIGIRVVRLGEFAWSRLEPEPGEYRLAWLEQILDLAEAKHLSVVLGTPTAAPPKWLVDQLPDMVPVDANGHRKGFGSRRHYCFSHAGYRKECERIVTKLAQAFGEHPAVVAWQTDNEFGCHNTVHSYSEAARVAFRAWLRNRYGSIDQLNQAWGNVFWSMEYRNFDEIELPNLTVTEANPAHNLDYRRFSSDEVDRFNRLQADLIRQYSPGRAILHNFMATFLDFDHFEVSNSLDAASWDSYPLGALTLLKAPESHKARNLHLGDPDLTAFHHDLYRACGRGRFWVMEQQAGPVNWAAYNPAPHPGAVRLWTYEAIAHGAEVVSYFCWRQAPFAQEQMHSGLNLPNREPDVGSLEVSQTAKELDQIELTSSFPAEVALVYDYEAAWTLAVQPQGDGFDYFSAVLSFYRALRRSGLNVDVLPRGASLDNYKLVVIPPLPIIDPNLLESLKRFKGQILIGPRSGSKTANFQIPAELPPGPLQQLIPIKIVRVESLPDFVSLPLAWKSVQYQCHSWLEHVRTDLQPFIQLADGHGIGYRRGKVTYLASLPDQPLLDRIVEDLLWEEGLKCSEIPAGVRVRSRGQYRFFFNYNPEPVKLDLPPKTRFVLGSAEMPVAGVTIVEGLST